MTNVTHGRFGRSPLEDSAERLAGQIEAQLGLLGGLAALRQLGRDGEGAVGVLLALAGMKILRLSWELYDVLADDLDVDADELLQRHATAHDLGMARLALWNIVPGERTA